MVEYSRDGPSITSISLLEVVPAKRWIQDTNSDNAQITKVVAMAASQGEDSLLTGNCRNLHLSPSIHAGGVLQ